MQPQTQPPWWVSSIAVPAFFTVLGFFVGQAKDWWQSRRSKQAFLEAIAVELGAITAEFEEAVSHLTTLLVAVQASGHAPQLIPKWGTKVFDTQLGKLSNAADDLIGRTIGAYSAIGRIERIVAMLNENSSEYANARDGNAKAAGQSRLASSIRVLSEEINKTVPTLRALIQRLPHRKGG
jgi:hypothetical protein